MEKLKERDASFPSLCILCNLKFVSCLERVSVCSGIGRRVCINCGRSRVTPNGSVEHGAVTAIRAVALLVPLLGVRPPKAHIHSTTC